MTVRFDIAKDARNIAKHGISLARAAELEMRAIEVDERFAYSQVRYRAWGVIDGQSYALAFTIEDGLVRAISLRRAHTKEMKRHVG